MRIGVFLLPYLCFVAVPTGRGKSQCPLTVVNGVFRVMRAVDFVYIIRRRIAFEFHSLQQLAMVKCKLSYFLGGLRYYDFSNCRTTESEIFYRNKSLAQRYALQFSAIVNNNFSESSHPMHNSLCLLRKKRNLRRFFARK